MQHISANAAVTFNRSLNGSCSFTIFGDTFVPGEHLSNFEDINADNLRQLLDDSDFALKAWSEYADMYGQLLRGHELHQNCLLKLSEAIHSSIALTNTFLSVLRDRRIPDLRATYFSWARPTTHYSLSHALNVHRRGVPIPWHLLMASDIPRSDVNIETATDCAQLLLGLVRPIAYIKNMEPVRDDDPRVFGRAESKSIVGKVIVSVGSTTGTQKPALSSSAVAAKLMDVAQDSADHEVTVVPLFRKSSFLKALSNSPHSDCNAVIVASHGTYLGSDQQSSGFEMHHNHVVDARLDIARKINDTGENGLTNSPAVILFVCGAGGERRDGRQTCNRSYNSLS